MNLPGVSTPDRNHASPFNEVEHGFQMGAVHFNCNGAGCFGLLLFGAHGGPVKAD